MKPLSRFFKSILFVLLFSVSAFAKTLPVALLKVPLLYDSLPGPLILSSQAEVDAFNFTSIGGDMTISGSDITNVDSLYRLKKVGGNLFINGNPNLINIDGLLALTSVNGIVDIRNNSQLTNLEGLSSLTSVGIRFPGFTSIMIADNPVLISVQGLRSLITTPGTWQIENNATLPNLDGLESLTQIGSPLMRVVSLIIKNNTALADIDGLSGLHSVGGYFLGMIDIEDNPALANLNGLSSLTTIIGGFNAGLMIKRNVSLTQVDGLSSFVNIDASQGFIDIQDNPNLTRGCALYTILHNSDLTGFSIATTISGNGPGFTKEEILADGPCPGSTIGVQPTQLSITNATGHSLKLAFTNAELIPNGYITLMRAYGSPSPDDAPVDGTTYHVGDIIGSGTTVVGVGRETTFTVTSLIPNTNYYFAIFAYYVGNDYVTLQPLEGNQSTTNETTPGPSDPTVQASNLEFSEITSNSLVVSFTPPTEEVPDGYITFVRAFASPFPEDVPISGSVNYHLGDIIGSSTVVVGFGPSTSLSIESLIPGTEYFFDVYAYHMPNEGGPIFLISGNPLSGSVSTTFSDFVAANRITPYPNPFTEEITIPFTVKDENTLVQIIIFDAMGKKIVDLANQRFDQGRHEVKWDRTDNYGSKVTQGLYKYSVITSESMQRMWGTLVAR